VMEGLLCE